MNTVADVKESSCCGCGACSQICPKNCITMQENDRGFLVPVVDESKCVNCGACVKSCPERNDVGGYKTEKAYAAVAKNAELLTRSTSGGVFGALAKQILSENGVVFGCAWDDDFSVKHIKVSDVEELSRIQQSKYLQSDMQRTYIETREALNKGIKVLYSGTGCQIAGLRQYLKREYDNLVTVEVACHGAPSAGLFKEYIKWLSKKVGSRIVSFQFRNRDKHKTGEHYKFCVQLENGSKKYFLADEDPFYGSFLKGLTLRETCYGCKYKKETRVADITLSDYWGIEKELKQFPAQNGASAVLLNTSKGRVLFELVKDGFITEETTFEAVVRHNHSMVTSTKYPKVEIYKKTTQESLFENLKPKANIKKKIKNMIPGRVKYLLKRL